MVCQIDNIIYFWKGKKYSSYLSDSYSYLDNVIFKDEKCPGGTKNCGIIDSNGNELCISSNLKCPINYISEKKLSKDYTSVLIGNKTFLLIVLLKINKSFFSLNAVKLALLSV